MTGGLSSYRQSMFADSQPPTIFSPASPKMEPLKSEKEIDNASMMSTSTYKSTMSLLKSKLKSKKESKKESKSHTEKKESPKDKKSRKLDPPDWNARARMAEAYMIQATLR